MKKFFLFSTIILALVQVLNAQTDEVIWLKLAYDDLGMQQPMLNAIYTPDFKSILASSADKFLELDAETGAIKREIPNIKGAFKFSDDGKYIYTYDFKKVNYETGEVVGQFEVPERAFTGGFDLSEEAGLFIGLMDYSNGGYSSKWRRGVYIYDLKTFKFIDTIGLKDCYRDGVQFVNHGKYFILYSYFDNDPTTEADNHWVKTLWDSKKIQMIDTINYPLLTGVIKNSPDDKWIGSAGLPYVRVFDAQTFKEKYKWDPNNGVCPSNAICFTKDSKYLLSKGPNCWTTEDNLAKIRIWDLNNGNLAYKYNTALSVDNIEISSNNYVLTFSSSGIVMLRWPKTLSVDEKIPDNKIIFPNPTTGEFIIKNPNFKAGSLNIILTDIIGKNLKTLYNRQYNQEELKFNVRDLPNGVYLLKAVQNADVYSFKLIKE